MCPRSDSTCRRWYPRCSLSPARIIRFGTPPFCIEVTTSIDGVEYNACRASACRASAVTVRVDGQDVPVISRADLKTATSVKGAGSPCPANVPGVHTTAGLAG